MRVHKARGAAYDLDKERQWNWFRPGRGERRSGPVTHLSKAELLEFCEREGYEVACRISVRDVRHG